MDIYIYIYIERYIYIYIYKARNKARNLAHGALKIGGPLISLLVGRRFSSVTLALSGFLRFFTWGSGTHARTLSGGPAVLVLPFLLALRDVGVLKCWPSLSSWDAVALRLCWTCKLSTLVFCTL